jgi:peptide/nickel transport system substrate-binding protein
MSRRTLLAILGVIIVILIAAALYYVTLPPTKTPTPTPTVTTPTTPTNTTTVTPAIKNPDKLIEAIPVDPGTLDPAWARTDDIASGGVIFNMYETLIFFDRESVDKFVPMIATQVPSFENGLIKDNGTTIIFPIRKGIKFHSGRELTPEDVEYSLERVLVMDRDGGSSWMLLDPLLGVQSTRDEKGNIIVSFEDIDKAVEVQGDSVVLHLKKPYPITTLFQILSLTLGSIVDKECAIAHGDWDGTEKNWTKYNKPENPPLQEADCGSGPFMLDRWEHGKQVVLKRFDQYWRGPANFSEFIIMVGEWNMTKLMFLKGDLDIAYVPSQNVKEVEGEPGIRVIKNLPILYNRALFFNFNISPTSPYIGSGKLDGEGIPPNFFQDKNVRLAFVHSIDYDRYIEEACFGEAIRTPGPIPQGLPGYFKDMPMYTFDPKKAEEYFKKAWNGQLWEEGFKLTILYGDLPGKTLAEIIKDKGESINPKFKIEIKEVDWFDHWAMVGGELPFFVTGWRADYPDPYNFIFAYMHSSGTFAARQKYKNERVDKLVEELITTMDPRKREDICRELTRIYYEDVPSVIVEQPLERHYERDWVHGWYYNPVYPGIYAYPLWKG